MPWETPTDFVAGTVVTEAMLDKLSSILTTGVMRPLAEVSLTVAAASLDIASIPATYRHLAIVAYVRGDVATSSTTISLRFNNDSAANYAWEFLRVAGTGISATENLGTNLIGLGNVPAGTAPGNAYASFWMVIPNSINTAQHKGVVSQSVLRVSGTGGGQNIEFVGGMWFSTVAINRVTLVPGSGNFAGGSMMTLYGIPNL